MNENSVPPSGPTVLSWKKVMSSDNSNSNHHNRFQYLTTASHVMGKEEGRIDVEIEEDRVSHHLYHYYVKSTSVFVRRTRKLDKSKIFPKIITFMVSKSKFISKG